MKYYLLVVLHFVLIAFGIAFLTAGVLHLLNVSMEIFLECVGLGTWVLISILFTSLFFAR